MSDLLADYLSPPGHVNEYVEIDYLVVTTTHGLGMQKWLSV